MTTPLSISGAILLDKPEGLTSHDVVARLRFALRTKRIGHTGTLDPFATGLMIICLGPSTRLSQFLTGKDKTYHATVRFGFATDTQDYTGKPLSEPISVEGVTDDALREVIKSFTGPQDQTPPMFSAKKVEGVALHRLARQGQVIFRTAVPIQIHALEWVPGKNGALRRTCKDGGLEADFIVTCSAGTYIRTLAHDLGERLGCGAHLTVLRRTHIGDFSIDRAMTIEQVNDLAAIGIIQECLIKPNELLADWPQIQLSPDEQVRFCHGQAIPFVLPAGITFTEHKEPLMTICNEGKELLGIGRFDAASEVIRPQIVFSE